MESIAYSRSQYGWFRCPFSLEAPSHSRWPPYWGVLGGALVKCLLGIVDTGLVPLHCLSMYLVASSQRYVHSDHSVQGVQTPTSAIWKYQEELQRLLLINIMEFRDEECMAIAIDTYHVDPISYLPYKSRSLLNPSCRGTRRLDLIVDKKKFRNIGKQSTKSSINIVLHILPSSCNLIWWINFLYDLMRILLIIDLKLCCLLPEVWFYPKITISQRFLANFYLFEILLVDWVIAICLC